MLVFFRFRCIHTRMLCVRGSIICLVVVLVLSPSMDVLAKRSNGEPGKLSGWLNNSTGWLRDSVVTKASSVGHRMKAVVSPALGVMTKLKSGAPGREGEESSWLHGPQPGTLSSFGHRMKTAVKYLAIPTASTNTAIAVISEFFDKMDATTSGMMHMDQAYPVGIIVGITTSMIGTSLALARHGDPDRSINEELKTAGKVIGAGMIPAILGGIAVNTAAYEQVFRAVDPVVGPFLTEFTKYALVTVPTLVASAIPLAHDLGKKADPTPSKETTDHHPTDSPSEPPENNVPEKWSKLREASFD